MKKNLLAGIIVIGALAIFFLSRITPIAAEEVNKNGFHITYDAQHTVSYKENPVYYATPYPQPTPTMFTRQMIVSAKLTGKVANELFRNIASMTLHFRISDAGGSSEEKIITLSNLGPHENQEFSLPLGQRVDDPNYRVAAKLTGIHYFFKDGKSEEVRF
jgi:hypothetical protein